MALVDKEIVSELVASGDPDAALVFSRGSCVVRSGEEAGSSGGVVIARRDAVDVELAIRAFQRSGFVEHDA